MTAAGPAVAPLSSDRHERAALLGETELFGLLDGSALDAVAARVTARRYPKGQIVFHEGDPGDALFVVAEGLVKIFVTSQHGAELVLATLGQAGTFGEVAMFDGGLRSASAVTLEPATLLVLRRDDLLDVVRNHPAVTEALHRSMARLVRRLLDTSSDLVFLDLGGRIAKLLLQLAEERGRRTGDGVSVDLGMTQSDLAAMAGGSRPMVNRILKRLEQRGCIDLRGKAVLIRDADALRRQAAT